MPMINFSKIKENDGFPPLPVGQYLCELIKVKDKNDDGSLLKTKKGDEKWNLTFKIIEGNYSKRLLFDDMIFSESAYPRVKLICSRLGINTENDLDLTKDMLINQKCWITVDIEQYNDRNGVTKDRNKIPYDGYNPCAKDEGIDNDVVVDVANVESKEDIPF